MAHALPAPIPRSLLAGAGMLVVATLLIVGLARLSGFQPARPAPSAVVGQVALRFEDRADGGIAVFAPGADAPFTVLPPESHHFVRGVMRGLARERRAREVGTQAPFILTRWADGRLSLDDPPTGRHIDLEVFGPDNAGSFADIYRRASPGSESP